MMAGPSLLLSVPVLAQCLLLAATGLKLGTDRYPIYDDYSLRLNCSANQRLTVTYRGQHLNENITVHHAELRSLLEDDTGLFLRMERDSTGNLYIEIETNYTNTLLALIMSLAASAIVGLALLGLFGLKLGMAIRRQKHLEAQISEYQRDPSGPKHEGTAAENSSVDGESTIGRETEFPAPATDQPAHLEPPEEVIYVNHCMQPSAASLDTPPQWGDNPSPSCVDDRPLLTPGDRHPSSLTPDQQQLQPRPSDQDTGFIYQQPRPSTHQGHLYDTPRKVKMRGRAETANGPIITSESSQPAHTPGPRDNQTAGAHQQQQNSAGERTGDLKEDHCRPTPRGGVSAQKGSAIDDLELDSEGYVRAQPVRFGKFRILQGMKTLPPRTQPRWPGQKLSFSASNLNPPLLSKVATEPAADLTTTTLQLATVPEDPDGGYGRPLRRQLSVEWDSKAWPPNQQPSLPSSLPTALPIALPTALPTALSRTGLAAWRHRTRDEEYYIRVNTKYMEEGRCREDSQYEDSDTEEEGEEEEEKWHRDHTFAVSGKSLD